ncbi:MAG: hypothetical protein LBP54_03225 [Campylobacteraceae bacterium]|jgi:hypothetical protein|nr:hypothetical protein [Campylobacteraceae bacterium]
MMEDQKSRQNYKKWNIYEDDFKDEEILFRVDKRKWFYIWVGSMLPGSVLLLMSIPMLIGENTTILLMCIGLILFIFGMRIFMSTISFNELIITKERAIIRRFFVRDECIYINNIKSIEIITYAMAMNDIFFICKNERRYAFMLRLTIPGLYDKDSYKIEEIIKTLQQEQNNGKLTKHDGKFELQS